MTALSEKRPSWLWAVIIASLVLALGIVYVTTLRRPVPAAKLLEYLPHGDRVLVSLDAKTLRAGGFLDAAPSVAEETEYKSFVAASGFDYHRDLDQLYLSIGGNETYAWIVGRFDWKRLQSYAASQGGKCTSGVCRLDSPTPGRKIGFRRNGSGMLAFASSANPDAVQSMFQKPVTAPPPAPPSSPVWFLIPHAVLQPAGALPAGSRMFVSAISTANHAFLSVGPKDSRYEAVLDAVVNNDEEARMAVLELKGATTVLNRMLAREQQTPNAHDLSGVLTKGEFVQDGLHVRGKWPVERAFLQSLNLSNSAK